MRSDLVRRVVSIVLGVGLALLVTLAALLQSPENEVPRSVGNSKSGGWRALYLLFDDLGLEPEVWTAQLADLPAGRHVLWWGTAPRVREDPDETEEDEEPSEADERAAEQDAGSAAQPDPLELARANGPRAGRHLRRFLVQGGRLVAMPQEDMRHWLEHEAGLYEFEGTTLESFEVAEGRARLAGGDSLRLALREAQRLEGLAADLPCEVLLRDAAGAALIVEVPIGRGGVVFVPEDSLFDNDELGSADAALLAVRLVETLAPGGRLLLDEGVLGLGPTRGLSSVLLGADLRLASLHALLLGLLAVWLSAWPREFARDPARNDLVAPLERVRAVAGLAARADRVGVLALPLRRGVLRRVARRLRVKLPREPDLDAELAAVAAVGDARFDAARWRGALQGPAPADLKALAALDRELRSLEDSLAAPEAPRSADVSTVHHETP